MRREDREIKRFDKMIEVMKRCEICHVAFHDEGYPYVVPMNFGMNVKDENVTLFFHGADIGRKHDLIKKDNRVSFVMEDTHSIVTGPEVGACECTMEFESVMGRGMIGYVSETEKPQALYTILKQYGVSEGENNYHFHDEVVPRTTVLCLKAENLTAKRRKVGRP